MDQAVRDLAASIGQDINELRHRPSGGGGSGAPTRVLTGTTTTISAYQQVPYRVPPRLDGLLVMDGLLVEV